MAAPDNKLKLMEEEMSRFEAEIASHTLPTPASVASAASASMNILYPTANMFIPHQLQSAQLSVAPPPMPPGVSLYTSYFPPALSTYPTQSTVVPAPDTASVQPASSTAPLNIVSTSSDAAPKVIVAPPQMAGPTELAARAKETSKWKPPSSAVEDDDDVTRALLAAAAGVTYKWPQDTDSTKKSTTTTAKPTSTPVVPTTAPVITSTTVVNSSKTTPLTIVNKNQSAVTSLPPPSLPPPPYRAAPVNNANAAQPGKKKKYIRMAAGVTWVDPTLTEWDPNDFRMFCGDLGNDVSDDVLTRAFNRYPSFQKAKVVRDKRTGKSRGYGFVSFSDPADFTKAMREMNGKYVGNRPIKLKRSDWRSRQLETHRKKEKERRKLGLKN